VNTDATFNPPGPVAQAYFEADMSDPFPLLMGPVGSAKTTTGLLRALLVSYMLKPSARDGVRRGKFAVIRRLYKDLEKTTMQSWLQWFPKTVGQWRGGAGDPATHIITIPHPKDGGPIELVMEFIALGDLRMEEALRGWEGTGAFIDELDGLPGNSTAFLLTRLGRYHKECGGDLRSVWAATNAPEADNWVVEDYIDNPKPGCKLYRQPGGLDRGAENLHNLPTGYYEKLADNLPAHDKRRFVDNIPGLSRGNDPVYEEFDADAHVSGTPIALLGTPLIVGMDAGGTPAAGIWQRAPNGQWRKLRELTTHLKEAGSITGPIRFGEMLGFLIRELMQTLPRGTPAPTIRGLSDPSAAYGADTANGESTWIDTVARTAGIAVFPAPTNDPTPRQEAYRRLMTRRIDGRTPALLIDPSCRMTIRALARDYRYGHILGQNARRTDKPLKNWASHLIEADQYGLLDGDGYFDAMGRTNARRTQLHVVPKRRVINPFAA